ncbi:hypothetical protein ES708_11482 [subsurface metagenome]
MYRIQAKIRACYHLSNTIRQLLDEALDLANDADYDAHWIAAINTAKNDNLQVWHHTYNVATCLDPTAPLPQSEEQ